MGDPNVANRTIWTGDNLDILRGMNSACVDLIYLDPPFNSNRTYEAPVGSAAAGAAFKDSWTLSDLDAAWLGLIADQHQALYSVIHAAGLAHGKSMQAYLCMMAVRLIEMRRVLKSTGSIYLHCDPTASHYLKLTMDAIFGIANFRNEIVWCYAGGGHPARDFPRKHDVILRYVTSEQWTFNRDAVRVPYDSDYKATVFARPDSRAPRRTYRPHPDGKVVEDWWRGLARPYGDERMGYPTQKPRALLERIIAASSNPGDVVLDPFCGCATSCVAAERLDRQWIGIDLSPKAADLVLQRLDGPEYGEMFRRAWVTVRSDIPVRTDIETPVNYRKRRHELFGRQEGRCRGCGHDFPFRNFTVDHIVPRSRGGTDDLANLQLLCGACNSLKGNRPHEYLVARLIEQGIVSAPGPSV